jgi:hypothetical protein
MVHLDIALQVFGKLFETKNIFFEVLDFHFTPANWFFDSIGIGLRLPPDSSFKILGILIRGLHSYIDGILRKGLPSYPNSPVRVGYPCSHISGHGVSEGPAAAVKKRHCDEVFAGVVVAMRCGKPARPGFAVSPVP